VNNVEGSRRRRRRTPASEETAAAGEEHHDDDNFNMSPGMDAIVFYKDEKTGKIVADRKVWGLVTKNGTSNHPLPTGMSQHFSNLMFNARTDTFFSKPTFSRLAGQGKSCVVALDGFFEWKAPPSGKGKKQPYYVYRKQQPSYLLMAGLYTSVNTDRDDPALLSTFTILTTEVCEPLAWLHSRMPVLIWDEALAKQWLDEPNSQTPLAALNNAAQRTSAEKIQWHEVSTQMSSTKF